MSIVFIILAIIFVALTFLSMLGGFTVMMKGNQTESQRSNKFMQLRVLFQALALGCLALSAMV